MLNVVQMVQASRILQHYGIDNQVEKAIEELAECIVALVKRDVEATPGEIADVYITLEQVVKGMGIWTEVSEQIQFKLARQEGRMNSEVKREKDLEAVKGNYV